MISLTAFFLIVAVLVVGFTILWFLGESCLPRIIVGVGMLILILLILASDNRAWPFAPPLDIAAQDDILKQRATAVASATSEAVTATAKAISSGDTGGSNPPATPAPIAPGGDIPAKRNATVSVPAGYTCSGDVWVNETPMYDVGAYQRDNAQVSDYQTALIVHTVADAKIMYAFGDGTCIYDPNREVAEQIRATKAPDFRYVDILDVPGSQRQGQ